MESEGLFLVDAQLKLRMLIHRISPAVRIPLTCANSRNRVVIIKPLKTWELHNYFKKVWKV